MLSIQQLIKALRNNTLAATTAGAAGDLLKSLQHVDAISSTTFSTTTKPTTTTTAAATTAPVATEATTAEKAKTVEEEEEATTIAALWAATATANNAVTSSGTHLYSIATLPKQQQQQQQQQQQTTPQTIASNSSQTADVDCEIISKQKQQTLPAKYGLTFSLDSCVLASSSTQAIAAAKAAVAAPPHGTVSNEIQTYGRNISNNISAQLSTSPLQTPTTKIVINAVTGTGAVVEENQNIREIINSNRKQTAETSSSIAATTTTTTTPTTTAVTARVAAAVYLQRNQQIQKFYLQQLQHFHTAQQHQQPSPLCSKQKQTQFAMSSLAAEPLVLKQEDIISNGMNGSAASAAASSNGVGATTITSNGTSISISTPAGNCTSSSASSSDVNSKACFNTGLGEILQFMELIGNLKHTKRTGWVLRDVNDCESISGHMYRMSMMTFLLDGSEGLNQIRCMELALVHDLAESLVGDITPFCGVSKTEKRAMEFKAMADICKLIEPRGKRIMELFEEYEEGASAESKFVKDLDRLDMVMQAFEYEKRDNCLLKHQEFFDSTEGKFNHPFVKKLVNEIYEQRRTLAKDKGATPPPPVLVPSMEEPTSTNSNSSNISEQLKQQNSSTSS